MKGHIPDGSFPAIHFISL